MTHRRRVAVTKKKKRGEFLPTSLSGLQLWLRADSLGLDDGDAVSMWRDESGQGNDATQGTAAAQPTFKSGVVNGKPAVRFDGADDVLAAATDLGLSGEDQPHTTFYVGQTDAATNVDDPRAPAGLNNTGDNNPLHEFARVESDETLKTLRREDAGTLKDPGSTESITNASPFIAAEIFTGTAVTIRLDGVDTSVSGSALDVGTVTLNELAVGNFGSSRSPNWAGDIGELVIFSRKLSDSEVEQMESYLNGRWATF